MHRSRSVIVVSLIVLAAACAPAPSAVPTPRATAPAPSASATPRASGSVAVISPVPVATRNPGGAFDPTGVTPRVSVVLAGLRAPVDVVHAGDGSGRLFIAEQAGRIRIVRDGALVDQPFLDIRDRIATGDGGSAGDPQGNGQRLDTLLGKILRIDVDSPGSDEGDYRIPDDNPFLDEDGAMPEIWLTGLRNPWRIRFDELNGALWMGDVGQGEWEEIDVAPAGVGGLNYGWNEMEGFDCFEPREGCDESGLTMPVAVYGHDLGCAVIGGVVVRDADQRSLNGGYLFSDSCSGNLWLLDAEAPGQQEPVLARKSGRSISAIGLDPDGTVLATALEGELLRITGGPR
jgi:glucose/arabinose dehydrogenase